MSCHQCFWIRNVKSCNTETKYVLNFFGFRIQIMQTRFKCSVVNSLIEECIPSCEFEFILPL